jgi:HAMP domain-containing protein
MRDQKVAMAPLAKLWTIAIGTAIAIVLVILLGLIVSNSVLKPIEQLEAEVRTVIEGNWEHRWEIKSTEVGGLSYLVNQMLDSLMEEDEEEGQAGGPVRQRATTEEEFMAQGQETTPESLAAEPEEQYYQRTYQEFQQAKAQLGENPDDVTFEQFVAKLRQTEQNILAKQPGRMVRFIVQVQGNKINYKPVHIP